MAGSKKETVRRMSRDALLTTLALALYVLEAQLPPPVPVPGIKLGLANIVTLFTLFYFNGREAAVVLFCRILLGSLFGGQLISLLFSAGGGLLAFLLLLLLKRILRPSQVWVAGVFAAMAHNLGQIFMARLVLGRPEVLAYLPLLMISGIITGLVTGITAQILLKRLQGVKILQD